MSESEKRRLDEAIQDIVTKEHDGAVVIGYNLVVAAIQMNSLGDGSTSYARWIAEGQTYHVSLGLAGVEEKMIDGSWGGRNA